MAKPRKPKQVLEDVQKQMINSGGKRVRLTTSETLLYSILEVLVYMANKR